MAKFTPTFRLGSIDVDPNTDQLKCGDNQIEIQSMAMKVLCYFCHHSDRLITRDNLRDDVWQNSATSNHTINNHIYSLRRNIAKLDPDVKYIHTVTGGGVSGYRLSETLTYTDQAAMEISADDIDRSVIESLPANKPEPRARQKRQFSYRGIRFTVLVFMICAAALATYQLSQPTVYQNVSLLTEQAGRELSPSISADGAFMLFSNKKSQDDSWELYAARLDSPQSSVKVFASERNHDNFVSISPSGERIAFNRLTYDEEGIYVAAFDKESLTASQERKLIPLSRDNLSPSISWLDEHRFFYSALEASWAPKKIFLYDITTGKSEQISSPALQSNGDFANVVSPNKQWLAILRSSGYGGVELVMYDIEAKSFVSTSVKLTHTRLNISFSDDSQQVYFIDDAGYLTQFDIKRHLVSRISKAAFMGYWPLKVPGKKQFILQQDWGLSSLTTEIVSFNNPMAGGDSSQSLVVNNGLSIRAIEGVGNNGFVFVSVKPNHQIELWRYRDGQAYKLDQFAEKEDYSYPLSISWLAGTEQALLSVNGSCRTININSGQDSPLCPKGESLYAGTYSSDGDAIYFAAFDDKQSKAVKMGSSGYPLQAQPLMTNANMIRDAGKGYLYYRVDPGSDIFQFDIKRSETKKLISRNYIANGYTTNDFVVVDEGIYFMDKPQNQNNAVYYYNFSDDSVRHLFDTPNLYPNIVLSEDHQYIYLIKSAHKDTGLLLVE